MSEGVIPALKLIWDLIVGTLKGYKSSRATLLKDHIDPLHDRVLRVHKDYMSGFSEARRMLADFEKPTASTIQFLRERRNAYQGEHDLSERLAIALSRERPSLAGDELWSLLGTYCKSIVTYFNQATPLGRFTWYEGFIDQAEQKLHLGLDGKDIWFDPTVHDRDPRQDLLHEIDDILNRWLPNALAEVNTAYADLRRKLL